jgi:hypothetical protein
MAQAETLHFCGEPPWLQGVAFLAAGEPPWVESEPLLLYGESLYSSRVSTAPG